MYRFVNICDSIRKVSAVDVQVKNTVKNNDEQYL